MRTGGEEVAGTEEVRMRMGKLRKCTVLCSVDFREQSMQKVVSDYG